MLEQIILFILLVGIGLYSAFGILVCSFAVIADFAAYARHAVDYLSIASSARRTLYTVVTTIFSSAFTMMIWYAYLLLMHSSDFRWFLISLAVLFCLFVILWCAAFYLQILTKRRLYLYQLPQDADELRLRQCKHGVMIAATFYPKVIDDKELVDTMSRASSVSMRIEVFPKLKHQIGLKTMKLTNDFEVFCNVSSEGYMRGYYGYLAAMQDAPDHLETQRTILQEWPETEESQQLMDILAPQFCE